MSIVPQNITNVLTSQITFVILYPIAPLPPAGQSDAQGSEMGAQTDFAGLDVTELDVETIVADDVMQPVLEWGYANFSTANAAQPIELRRVMVMAKSATRARVRLDDGREQDVHIDSLSTGIPLPNRISPAEIEQSRQEIPGIGDLQAFYRAQARRRWADMQRSGQLRRLG